MRDNHDIAVVIAHYDACGRVAKYLRRLVAHLDSVARRVIFVSTGLSSEGAALLARHAQVIIRENFGYDFWSYRVGIEALDDLGKFDQLWILNSSFIVFDPATFCAQILNWPGDADLLGLTRSTDCGPHLQSYCVAFRTRRVLDSPAFAQWWATMTPISDRLQVILRYEVGMSQHFVRAGFRTGAIFEPTREERLFAVLRGVETRNLRIPEQPGDGPVRLLLRDGERLNPTHYMWQALFDRCGILKIDLLRDNPHSVELRDLHGRLGLSPDYVELYEDAMHPLRLARSTPIASDHARLFRGEHSPVVP